MKDSTSGSGKVGTILGVALLVIVVGWQVQMGATIKEVGIPGIFTIKLGQKPLAYCLDLDRGYDRPGGDYNGGAVMDINECLRTCRIDDACEALSYNSSSMQCWLKSSPGLRVQDSGFVSAVKRKC